MLFTQQNVSLALSALAIAALTACGGGGSSAVSQSQQITGTAAIGAALGNAAVVITNSAGSSPCQETTITTTQLGSYTCTLRSGEAAPFFIVVTDPTGNTTPLVSIATTTPAVGTPLLVNATPLTTVIVGQLNGGDALGVVSNKSLYVPAAFEAVKSNVIGQIQSIVDSIDPNQGRYDPFTTSITAATAGNTGNTADKMLDVIKITQTASGAPALSTISDSTPIAVATSSVSGAKVPAPDTSVSDLTAGVQILAQTLKACFELPVSQRVTLDANKNVTSVSQICQALVTQEGSPSGAPAFKSSGYNFIQSLGRVLSDDLMTSAKFSVPEIMSFYPAQASAWDKAVINIRFLNNEGSPGNFISVVQNIPSTSTQEHLSNWWLTGNQKKYDLSISANVRRNEGFNTTNPNTAPSRFQNGMDIYINGAIDSAATAPGFGAPSSALFDSAKVTGLGLPTEGLWYARSPTSGQFSITTYRNSSPTNITALQDSFVCPSCSTFWMSKTKAVSGGDALLLASNTTHAIYGRQWAQESEGSYNGKGNTTSSRPVKGAVYTFALYKNGVLFDTETRTLLTDLVPATQAINMQWNGIGEKTKSALDINNAALNGAQSALTIDWIQNPSAEQIRSVWVSQTDGGYDNATKFQRGATSVIATPYSRTGTTTFTALAGAYSQSAAPYKGFREIGFSYRMLDGSTKHSLYTYDQ